MPVRVKDARMGMNPVTAGVVFTFLLNANGPVYSIGYNDNKFITIQSSISCFANAYRLEASLLAGDIMLSLSSRRTFPANLPVYGTSSSS